MYKIPVKPISVNKIFQGRRFKTREYSDWRDECWYHLGIYKLETVAVPCELHLNFYCSKNFKNSDIDNFCKGAIDSLVEAKVLQDDKLIEKLVVQKLKSEKDYWEFDIFTL